MTLKDPISPVFHMFVSDSQELEAVKPSSKDVQDYSFASKGNATELLTPCPAWMSEYAVFHNAHKHSPTAKYLIYHCASSVDQACNGLGDRLRGIMYMTRVAHGSKRIFLINNTAPVDLSNVFLPTAFDWRVGNISSPCQDMTNPSEYPCESIDEKGRHVSSQYWTSRGGWGVPEWISNGSMTIGAMAEVTHFYMTACTYSSFPLGPWAPFLPNWHDPGMMYQSHCLFSLLFQASTMVDQRVREFEVQLGIHHPGREARYVALHLRLGVDNTLEQREVHPELNAIFLCARKLGQLQNLTDLAVATDSGKMRKAIRDGTYPGFMAVDILAAHIHFMPHDDEKALEKFVDTVAEFVLLARSTCVIMSSSGFSETAHIMGGQPCWSTMDMCASDFHNQAT